MARSSRAGDVAVASETLTRCSVRALEGAGYGGDIVADRVRRAMYSVPPARRADLAEYIVDNPHEWVTPFVIAEGNKFTDGLNAKQGKGARQISEEDVAEMAEDATEAAGGMVGREAGGDGTRFAVSRNNRATIEKWLSKRGDLDETERNAFWHYVEDREPMVQLAMGKWFANGAIRLPEDQLTVDEAIKAAKKMKTDPMRYDAPGQIVTEYRERFGVEDARAAEQLLSPDDGRFAGILTGKKDYGNGITVYTVQDNAVGQRAVRELMNDHLGKDFNCWCLLYANANGEVTEGASADTPGGYWRYYNGVPKRVAFKDGKICAFCASDDVLDTWWDLSDKSHGDAIPVEMAIPGDALGRRTIGEYDEASGVFTAGDLIFRGNRKNGIYEEWYSLDPHSLKFRGEFKNGIHNGELIEWNKNGSLRRQVTNYTDDAVKDAVVRGWHDNGQPRTEVLFDKYLMKEYRAWNDSGKLIHETIVNSDGSSVVRTWDDEGSLRYEFVHDAPDTAVVKAKEFYKNGEVDFSEDMNYDGDDRVFDTFRVGGKKRLSRTWHTNGALMVERLHDESGNFIGAFRSWYSNGLPNSEQIFDADGDSVLWRKWSASGQLLEEDDYAGAGSSKGGWSVRWNEDGSIRDRKFYVKGRLADPPAGAVPPSNVAPPSGDRYDVKRVTPAEDAAFRQRMAEWMSQANLDAAKGLNREEIFAKFGNGLEAVAHINPDYMKYLDPDISDPRVYSGLGYMLDHAVNHHPEVAASEYSRIQDIIDNPDDVKLDDRNPARNKSLIFIREIEGSGAVVISFYKESNGKILLHKSFFNKMKKNRFAKMTSVKLNSPSVVGNPTISHADASASAGRLSALESENKIPQSSGEVNGAEAERAEAERLRRAVAKDLLGDSSRSSVTRGEPRNSAIDLAAGFAAARILGGAKIGVDDLDVILKNLGIRGVSAADALRDAQALADRNRDKVADRVRRADPSLFSDLAEAEFVR